MKDIPVIDQKSNNNNNNMRRARVWDDSGGKYNILESDIERC